MPHKHVEGTRARLTPLAGLAFLDETEPGSFAQPGDQAQSTPSDQRS